MKVKANRVVAYGGKEHEPGEVFEMDDTHAKVNIFNGRVSSADTPQPKGGKPEAKRETLSAKKGRKGKHDEGEDHEKGRYKRRDVRAEDDDPHEGD
jgi:hypothetical protein